MEDSDLHKEPIEIAKELFKMLRPNLNSKRLKTKFGFWLQAHFGRKVWTLKDLTEEQLIEAIVMLNNKKLNKFCCEKHPK